MEFWQILLIILLILILIIIGRIIFEITHPQIRRCRIKTDKLGDNEKIRIVFMADLHSRKYGKNNIKLIRMVSNARPDFIICGGDMINAGSFMKRDERTLDALSGFINIAPVFYVPGNHERKLAETARMSERFDEYMFELECMDIPWLSDQSAILTEDITVHGLDIGLKYYKKTGKTPSISTEYITEKLGEPDRSRYNILVAHNPAFFDTYIDTDYDLILCGHYHGGLVNLPWTGPLISPDFRFRPQHSGGVYKKSGKIVVVTRGIGSHLINIRLFNRPEVMVLDLCRSDDTPVKPKD